VASTTEVRTKRGEIPLLTVEVRGGKPEITSTPVVSADQAASVASAKAADGDLIGVDVDKPVHASATNDPRFGEQWSFTKVPFEAAWTADGTQGAGVTVAVVDTGVMADHADLSGQVRTGAHFLHSDAGEPVDPAVGGTEDFSGHGTHVAGTIAAKSNNGTGVSGAAPGAQILPVKVLCADGGGFTSDVADGITWAVDAGADVINLSLGGGATSGEEAAIAYARDHNVVVAAAGGNDGAGGTASYPAAYSTQYANVIAVAATDNTNGHPAYGTTGGYLERRRLLLDRRNLHGYATRLGRRCAAPRCERRMHGRAGEEPAQGDGDGPPAGGPGQHVRRRPRQPARRRRLLHLTGAHARP
jgi:subtilisin family serine protease